MRIVAFSGASVGGRTVQRESEKVGALSRWRRTACGVGVAVCASLVAAGCGGGGDDEQAPAAASEPDAGSSTVKPVQIVSVGDTFRDGNFSFRVQSVTSPRRVLDFAPAAGAGFVRVKVEVTNSASVPINGPLCSSTYYTGIVLVDTEGRNYSPHAGSAELKDDPVCATPSQPGLARTVDLVWQIPSATVPEITGVAIWDPTESGDETGDGSYYFVTSTP